MWFLFFVQSSREEKAQGLIGSCPAFPDRSYNLPSEAEQETSDSSWKYIFWHRKCPDTLIFPATWYSCPLMSLGNHCQDSHVPKRADACVPNVQHCSSLHSLQTLPIHWTYISAATVMCMSAVYTQYIGNIDKRQHLDMFSTDKENFQPKVGWIHGAEVGKGRNVYTADYRTWSPL